jgi:hypothetical protein
MASSIIQLLAALIIIMAMSATYIVVFIKVLAWVLSLKTKVQKATGILFLLVGLPVLFVVLGVVILVLWDAASGENLFRKVIGIAMLA